MELGMEKGGRGRRRALSFYKPEIDLDLDFAPHSFSSPPLLVTTIDDHAQLLDTDISVRYYSLPLRTSSRSTS